MPKTWRFNAMCPDLILGWESNIGQALQGQNKLPKAFLIQLLFFNLCSCGAHPFNQSWSNQPWKSH